MSLRSKLLLSSLVVILIFSALYLTLSFAATNVVFGRYESYVQKQITDQIHSVLAAYYVKNGRSWEGIHDHFQPYLPHKEKHPKRSPLALLDENNQPVAVWPKGSEDRWKEVYEKSKGTLIPITVGDRQVGTLWVPTGNSFGVENIRSRVSSSILLAFVISVLASSAIAFIISYILASRISRPLISLSGAARQVGRRRFGLRLPVTSKDEIGVLIQAFNQMSEELGRSEQARRNLVADVAHELRTPLTVIQGQLESIQQGIMPASVETVLPIHDEVIRLNRLVDDLRQLTLAEAGKLPLNRIPTDLTRTVRKIADNFLLEAEVRGIELKVTGPGAPNDLPVDPDRFTQIVVNLLGNALNYTPAGGTVSLGLAGVNFTSDNDLAAWCENFSSAGDPGEYEPGDSRRPGGWSGVVVWVADRGPGIAPEHLPFVFDRFYRADQSRDRGTGGVGLGLAIAREFVVAHGGQITACNRKAGGSLFAFYLPVLEVGSNHGTHGL